MSVPQDQRGDSREGGAVESVTPRSFCAGWGWEGKTRKARNVKTIRLDKIAPCETTNLQGVLRLATSLWESRDYQMMVSHDGSVVISKHRSGEKATETIHIPRREFMKMLDWYQSPQ